MSQISLDFPSTPFQAINTVQIPDIFHNRFKTGIEMFDRFIGDGLVPSSTFTLTGTPGAGKTTLLLQVLESLNANGKIAGYISAEESIYQLALKRDRLGLSLTQVANMSDVDDICAQMEHFDCLAIDSFQFLTCRHIDRPKSLIAYAIKSIINNAAKTKCVVIIIQHLTTMGIAKGGTLVPHAVDGNLELENTKEGDNIKILRSTKNRNGRIGEITLQMGDNGFDFTQIIENSIPSEKMSSAMKRGSNDQEKILSYIKEHGFAGIGTLQTLFDPNQYWRIPHHLRALVSAKTLIKQGRGDQAVWKLSKSDDSS